MHLAPAEIRSGRQPAESIGVMRAVSAPHTGKNMQHQHMHAPEGSRPLSPSCTTARLPDEEQVRGIYRFMYRHVGNREEAEELTELACRQAMHTAAQDSPDGSNRRSMKSGLCRAARAIIEEHQARFYGSAPESQRDEERVDQPSMPAARPRDDNAMPEPLRAVFAQLSVYERDFLTYRFLRNCSLAEIAAQMRLSVTDALALQWSALNNAARLLASERMKRSASDTRPGDDVSGTSPSVSVASACRRSATCACRAARTE